MSPETALAAEPPTQGQGASFTYDAFLSYSHDDGAVAAGIQKGLHHIGRRVGQLNALHVFRDTTDLSANPNLWGRVTDAMGRSRYLIVVLSTHAAKSEWVNKEVDHWLQQRGPDQLLIVLAEGHLHWDEKTERFDPDQSDAAPSVLKERKEPGVLPDEPLYVDVSGDAPWDPHAHAFRDKVTDLAAPIHGKSKYELASDDVREQRRFRRLRRAAIAGLVLLTVIAVVAAAVAFLQRQEADRQRQEAVRQRNDAVALRLVAESRSLFTGDRSGSEIRGMQQLLAAYAIAPRTPKARCWTPSLHDVECSRSSRPLNSLTTAHSAPTESFSPPSGSVRRRCGCGKCPANQSEHFRPSRRGPWRSALTASGLRPAKAARARFKCGTLLPVSPPSLLRQ